MFNQTIAILGRFWQRFQKAPADKDIVVHVCEAFTDLYDQIDVYSPCFSNLTSVNNVVQVYQY